MKKLVVVGDPIEHSLSPLVYSVALKELGLEKDFHYEKLMIKTEELADFIKSIRKGEIAGASITMPHKVNIIQYIDELTKEAEMIGAVNTLYKKNGKVIGHNTDGVGCLKSLKENNVSVEGKKIVVMGAGGAARAIVFTLALNDVYEIVILNRTVGKAEELAREVKEKTETASKAGGLEKIKDELRDAEILINCTSVGMKGEEGTLVASEMLYPSLVVMDVVYNPLKTELIKKAEEAGCKTVNGAGMLVHQAAIGFEIWTGKKPPIKVMQKALLEHLRMRT
jgi:shikimate dehydrogenase